MELLLSLERCIGEERTLQAAARFLHRQETFAYLENMGRETAGLPAPYPHEHDLILLEAIASASSVERLSQECQAYRDHVASREEKRRTAVKQAEDAAHEFLLRCSSA